MSRKVVLKTARTNNSVAAYIKSLDKTAQKEAHILLELFAAVTKVKPKMWGSSIVGFGSYIYHRSNGDEGTYFATGFSMRKSGPTIYIMPGYKEYQSLLDELGVSYKLGTSCLYLTSLDGLKPAALKKLIRTGLADLKKTHPVTL